MSEAYYPPVSALRAGLRCRCPRCGEGALFSDFLGVAPKCDHCGLDFSGHDSGVGPAVFVTFVVGFSVVGLALLLEMHFAPPTWVHFIIELPLVLLGSLALLRPFKATLIALQFKHQAREYRFGDE